jgi:hypothetical protein
VCPASTGGSGGRGRGEGSNRSNGDNGGGDSGEPMMDGLGGAWWAFLVGSMSL